MIPVSPPGLEDSVLQVLTRLHLEVAHSYSLSRLDVPAAQIAEMLPLSFVSSLSCDMVLLFLEL